MSEMLDRHIKARATINLPGARAGDLVFVDPELSYIADCLSRGYLVPETAENDSTGSPTIVNGDEAA